MILKTQEHIQAMKEGGTLLSAILCELVAMVKPGKMTEEFDTKARELMKEKDVEPSFPTNGFPHAICASINDEAVHGVPSDRVLEEGDLFKIDIGLIYKGFHTDMAVTVLVSDNPKKKEYADRLTLIRVTRESLYAGIAAARAGNTIGHIGAAIQEVVEKNGLTIVRELGGHGIGDTLHQDPFIANHGKPGEGDLLLPGMAIALEPIVSNGGWKIKDGSDGHAYMMKDGSLTAHFEHTIIITEKAPIIVTE